MISPRSWANVASGFDSANGSPPSRQMLQIGRSMVGNDVGIVGVITGGDGVGPGVGSGVGSIVGIGVGDDDGLGVGTSVATGTTGDDVGIEMGVKVVGAVCSKRK